MWTRTRAKRACERVCVPDHRLNELTDQPPPCLFQIEDARVIMDRENPFRSRGFGFVTYARAEDAQNAIDMNHDKEWQGRSIRVNLASQPREPKKPL